MTCKLLASLSSVASLVGVAGSSWQEPLGKGWQSLTKTPPFRPHTGSIAVPLSDGSMLLTAGQEGLHGGATLDCFNCTKQVWRFAPGDEAHWTDLSKDVPWDPRWGHSAVAMPDDTVWLMFGCCEPGRPTVMFRDVWTFNPVRGVPWKSVSTVPPFEGIQAAAMAVHGKHIYVTGGWSQSRGCLSIVSVFDTETLEWTVKSENREAPWPTRADHAAAISPDGNWLVIFGGQHEEGFGQHWTRMQDSWRVPLPSCKASEWEQLGNLRAARSSPSVFVLRAGWIITLGGHWTPEDESIKVPQDDVQGIKSHHDKTKFITYNDVLGMNLHEKAWRWQTLDLNSPFPARDDAAASITSNGTVVIFGGGTVYGGGGYLQDVWRLPRFDQQYDLHSTKSAAAEL